MEICRHTQLLIRFLTQKDSISSFYELGQSQQCTVDILYIIFREAVKKKLFCDNY